MYRSKLNEKLQESLAAVLPILAIVLILSFTIAPLPTSVLMAFLFGAVLLVVGMMFFSLGAELAMSPMGERVGACITKTRRVGIMLTLGFLLGFLITISEPDLQVLANQVQAVPNMVLIVTVAVGVGLFLCFAMLRMLLSVPLNTMLVGFYIVVFVLAMFVPKDFLAVAFDSGGVTTGPMTVPFIMAMGVGVASIRSDKNAEADSFGLVALCSIGPILAVLILGFVYKGQPADIAASSVNEWADTLAISREYVSAVPHYMKEVAIALLPIVVFFVLFQRFALKLPKIPFLKILIGLLYTYAGLVIFLTGVNVGFSSLGTLLGQSLAESWKRYLLIPVAMLMGWFIVSAEPAVHVLNKQVEEISAGAVSERVMNVSLSIAISSAMGLAMVRVLTGVSILWFLVPGYVISLALSFFVPPMFTAIAFDSGGVASGPMTATFMLPFAMGACEAVGGNLLTDAFGLVALVALMPLITIQITGVVAEIKNRASRGVKPENYAEEDVIELWEVD